MEETTNKDNKVADATTEEKAKNCTCQKCKILEGQLQISRQVHKMAVEALSKEKRAELLDPKEEEEANPQHYFNTGISIDISFFGMIALGGIAIAAGVKYLENRK